jgi:hypothetical protein
MKKKFKKGDTVILDVSSLPYSEADKTRYYGALGYGRPRNKPLLFTFLCEHSPQKGHCVLINMETKQLEIMRHVEDFRKASKNEC